MSSRFPKKKDAERIGEAKKLPRAPCRVCSVVFYTEPVTAFRRAEQLVTGAGHISSE